MKNDQTLSDLFFSDELNVIHTAVSAGLGKVKSDVGTYSYQLATQADTAKVYWRLANYDVQAIAPANYVVEKDTIIVTVFPSDAQVEIEGKKVSVMQKVYGEKNPDGYFWLTNVKNQLVLLLLLTHSPRLHLLQKIIFLLKMRLTKVSRLLRLYPIWIMKAML